MKEISIKLLLILLLICLVLNAVIISPLLYYHNKEKMYIEQGYQRVLVPSMYREVWAKPGSDAILFESPEPQSPIK